MLELGTPAADFSLSEPKTGNNVSLKDFTGKPLLLVFSCNHCPFVLHILPKFVEFTTEYMAKGLSVVMINSNDVENFADDSPQKMVELGDHLDFSFPYLYDETQQVARAYHAACTPDLYLFDAGHTLVYRGQFDSSRPGNNAPVNGEDLRQAVDALLENRAISADQIPSLGCNIKWKPGNEPVYFN
jgi:peroxiredoxin